MDAPKTQLTAKIVAYCADCDSDLAESSKEHLGKNFLCPSDQTHHAAVVKGKEGRYWLRLESKLLCYQLKYSPSHRFCYSGHWVLVRLLALLIAVVIATYLPKSTVCGLVLGTILTGLVLYLVFDILAVNTSIAFISGSPANPLRSAFLALLSFFSVALAFSVLFALMPSRFDPPLNAIRAVYFGFITITTVGYGDVKPLRGEWLPQVVIVLEIMIGAYFLIILLAIFSSWVSTRAPCPRVIPLEDVRVSPHASSATVK